MVVFSALVFFNGYYNVYYSVFVFVAHSQSWPFIWPLEVFWKLLLFSAKERGAFDDFAICAVR